MTDQYNPSPRLGDRLEALLKEVRGWNRATSKDLRFRVASMGLKDRVRLAGAVKLRNSIRGKVKARNLELERVSFTFARHGIFLEHGVGKGRPVNSAAANRMSRPWLKPGIEDAIESLADLLSNEYADLAADELKIIIPGVINTKIKVNG